MPSLKLFFLGAPRLELEGQLVKVDTRKAVALLAYLALTGDDHTRDALAAFLWPEAGQKRARAALRRTLSALNKGLAGQWLEVDRTRVALEEGYWLDVEQFQQQARGCGAAHQDSEPFCADCLSAWSQAVQLYRDDFLAGFTLRDSAAFDDWQFFQAESLRQTLAKTLERLVIEHQNQQAWDKAIDYARRWLALDPLHEPAHRHLIRLYAWTDQRSAALRQYRECVRVLEQELGVPPLEETTQLYDAIQENQLRPPAKRTTGAGQVKTAVETKQVTGEPEPSLSSWPDPTSAHTLPLVGRRDEWAELLKLYTHLDPDGHLISLEGEAGIGKTRLAEEFLAYIRTLGGVALSARCYEGEGHLAYSPFIEIVRSYLGGLRPADYAGQFRDIPALWLSEMARLLPEIKTLQPDLPPPPPLDNPGAQGRFFEGLSQILMTLCRGQQPGVLFFDNLHWADEASLDLLTYMVRRLKGKALCLLVAWRDEDIPTDHRLRHLVAEGQRAGLVTRLALSRLPQEAVTELVRGANLAQPKRRKTLSRRLHRETEGLPFFLIEYLTMLANQIDLESDGALETEETDAAWSMPGGVRDLLHSRLAAVSETGWQVLTTAAVIGRSFEFDTVRIASGRSEEETIVALEALLAARLIAEIRLGEHGPVYDFNHEKLRDLVYEETSLARQRLLHRRVAEALAGRRSGRSDQGAVAGQIAHHYQRAGQAEQAAEYFKQAGDYTRTLFANAEALAHFRAALALGHPQTAELHTAIGDLLILSGEYNAALIAFETAAALSEPAQLVNIEHKLGEVHHRLGAWELAESHFKAALDSLESQTSETQVEVQARLYADWSRTAHQQGRIHHAIELAQQALALATRANDTLALAQTHNILGILASGQDNFEQARDHLRQSLELAEILADPAAQIAALNNLALTHSADNDFEIALALTKKALQLCAAWGDRHREAALHNNLADLLHAAGQPERAMAHLKQAVTIFAEIGAEAGGKQPEIWKLVAW